MPLQLPDGCREIVVGNRRIILVGTAHVSDVSRRLVRQVILEVHPDRVCVELDQARYDALSGRKKWQELDLKEVIRNRQLPTLLVHLFLSSYQKRLGLNLGVTPGAEMLEAVNVAGENNIPYTLCDREVGITLKRAWRSLSLWKKASLLSLLFVGIFEKPAMTEEDLARLQEQDVLTGLLDELGQEMPQLKETLIDERDIYMSEAIKDAAGATIVAVVGAGHVPGMALALPRDLAHERARLTSLPSTVPWGKFFGWGFTAILAAALLFIAMKKGLAVAGGNMLFWFAVNAVPSAFGAFLAGSHPVTMLSAFFAAPFTSLTPVIGAGYVTAFVQTACRPPRVRELESVAEEMVVPSMWWKNRVLKIFLAFLLPGIGSLVGTWLGGYRIFSELFR